MSSLQKIIAIFSLAFILAGVFYFFVLNKDSNSDSLSLFPSSPDELVDAYEAKAAISDDLMESILSDYKKIVPDEFKASNYFYPIVRFWFGIYTRYDSQQIVIHDKDNLDLVYSVLDFSKLKSGNVNRFAQSAIRQKIVTEKLSSIKAAFTELSEGKTNSSYSLNMLKLFRDTKISLPSDPLERKKFFEIKIDSIRTQTGQRDAIAAGIQRMGPYSVFLKTLFSEFQLPYELSAIPFLESSFNNVAESKVGALGIWQFMPHIGNHFMPKRSETVDYRSNPFIASIAALHLLQENHKILKSWDLAVTAYNSGTKHLIKARKELGIQHLEEIFIQYNHPHIGFASKNFYAEFLALVSTLAYRDEIFTPQSVEFFYDPSKLKIGPAKCSVNLTQLKKSMPENAWIRFKELNPHLLKDKSSYPRGTIFVSGDALTDKFVLSLKPQEWRKNIPARWANIYLRNNHNCSTR